MRVSEIRVKRIRVNQGLGVHQNVCRRFLRVSMKVLLRVLLICSRLWPGSMPGSSVVLAIATDTQTDLDA